MPFLLDTNVWVALLRGRSQAVIRRVKERDPAKVLFCSVVKAELIYGAYRGSAMEKNLGLLTRLFQAHASITFDDASALVYGRIRADLDGRGLPIGPYELQIAAIAVAHDLTIVTHNTSEFQRVAGLKLEDWQTDAKENPSA
jgi:tRNA(fMet)-specific endonuclease VapC